MKNELPLKIAMIDLEMTGVNSLRDDILEFGAIKCDLDLETMRYKINGKPLHFYIKTDVKPSRKFHFDHLMQAFENSATKGLTLEEAKGKIDEFLGREERRWPCGDCVTTDLLFLFNKGLIEFNDYDENDKEIFGHLDYRPFEMKPLKVLAKTLGWVPPEDQLTEHEALNDCYNQLFELNDCIKFLLENRKGA